jgi:hypothetical protein
MIFVFWTMTYYSTPVTSGLYCLFFSCDILAYISAALVFSMWSLVFNFPFPVYMAHFCSSSPSSIHPNTLPSPVYYTRTRISILYQFPTIACGCKRFLSHPFCVQQNRVLLVWVCGRPRHGATGSLARGDASDASPPQAFLQTAVG